MKKTMYGTVSALAMLLAVHGVAKADASSDSEVSFNRAFAVIVDNDNTIEDFAFGSARGAFQVQQNASINSSATQNMSIAAVIVRDQDASVRQAAEASSDSEVEGNHAAFLSVESDNLIQDNAFRRASGAFQVQQNASVNSSVGQNMEITAFVNKGGETLASQTSEAELSTEVTGNCAALVRVDGPNTITDKAFQHASGAFQVQQNNSVNSAVHQNMGIVAAIR
jgi:hypothetical protein